MKSIFHSLLLLTIVFTLGACATSKSNQALNEKVSEEKSVQTRDQLNAEVKQTIDNNTAISPEKKAQLEAIRADYLTKSDDLYKESIKLRSVLIKDIASQQEHVGEIKLIKARLREIADKRLTLLFKAIDDSNVALGKLAALHEREMQDMMREDRMSRLDH